MVHLMHVFSLVFAVLTSVNVFLHVVFLGWFKKRKRLGALVGLVLAGLNFYGMREIISTSGMALMTFSAALIGLDLIGLVLRIFPKGRAHAFYRKWKRRGLAFLIAALYVVYGLINIHIVRKTEYAFENENVKGVLTVSVVSDSHLGTAMDAAKLLTVARDAVAEGADLLVLAGDIVDENTEKEEFLRFAEGMKAVHAPKGVYFVFGNHDAPHWGTSITRPEMEAALSASGVTVLTDESILLDGWLRVCGRKDANDERMTPEALLSGAEPDNEFILMIDHQPAQTKACAEAGADLLVSGHTHNGQIFPVNLISLLLEVNEIEYGHKQIGSMHAVVSSGVSGWGSAFRTAGRSEYVMIEIRGIK